MVAEILTFPLVYPTLFFCDFYQIFEVFINIQTTSRTIHLSKHLFIEHYHSNHLISISQFQLSRTFVCLIIKHFVGRPHPLFCGFSLIFKVFINIRIARKSDCLCVSQHGYRILS